MHLVVSVAKRNSRPFIEIVTIAVAVVMYFVVVVQTIACHYLNLAITKSCVFAWSAITPWMTCRSNNMTTNQKNINVRIVSENDAS